MVTATDAPKTIVLSGGGTGGHITPILAVAHELKQLNSNLRIIYIGEKGGKFSELTAQNPDIDESYAVHAGKLRRYHGESWLKRLIDIKTNLLNVRDAWYVLLGIIEARRLLRKLHPHVVFLKGGFVGVPVGLAAKKRIPIVTHDSDVIPGLANRLVSRWVRVHATALPPELYAYPLTKTVQVGVLVEHGFQPVTPDQQRQFKQQLNLPPYKPVLLVTGSSSGAQRLNEAVRVGIDALLGSHPDLTVIHQVGKGKAGVYDGYQHERLTVLEFLRPMYVYMGAADLVVARASANTVAELGVQGKATIVVPSPFLASGHQIKNAHLLAEQGTAAVVYEDNLPEELFNVIERLLNNPAEREALAQKLHTQTIPDAAKRLAKILYEI